MQINLTFFLQLLNITITVSLLRKILWPSLLNVINEEDLANTKNIAKCLELQKKIQTLEESRIAQELSLAQTMHNTLGTLTPPPAVLASCRPFPLDRKISCEKASHSSTIASEALVSIIQQKF